MQAVRVTDVKVLDVAMEPVKGEVSPPCGVTGEGSVFAINHNADNSLITLRYRLEDADIQIAEEPFEAGGTKFARGSFVISNVSRADLDTAAQELGLKAHAVAAAPSVRTHAARAARVAILHGWATTQTEGWWRQAFDVYKIPYDYIDPQTIRDTANLRAKYDVIVLGPGGSQALVQGLPLWRNPIPYRHSTETPNIGTWAQTDDTRIGMGLQGLGEPEGVHRRRRRIPGVEQQRRVRDQQLHLRRQRQQARRQLAGGGIAAAHTAGGREEPAGLRHSRQPRDVQRQRRHLRGQRQRRRHWTWRRGRRRRRAAGGGRGGGPGRPTGRGTPDDPDVVQGRAAVEGSNLPPLPAPQQVQPWQYALPTEEQLRRNPATLIPPEFRPRVAVRFDAQNSLLVSGLLDGGADIAQRPVVVDVPVGKGHVVLFANNPIWRGSTIGSYFLVFNALLNHDSLNAGRTLDPR